MRDSDVGVPCKLVVGLGQTYFLKFFYASYYNIGVSCNLLLPCQGDRASLLAVFFVFIYDFALGLVTNFHTHFSFLCISKSRSPICYFN